MASSRTSTYTMFRENKDYDVVSFKLAFVEDAPEQFTVYKGNDKNSLDCKILLGADSAENLLEQADSWSVGDPSNFSQIEFDDEGSRSRLSPASTAGMGMKVQRFTGMKWKNVAILTEDQTTRLMGWLKRNV